MRRKKDILPIIPVSVDDFSAEALNNPILLLKELETLYEPKQSENVNEETGIAPEDLENASNLFRSFIAEVSNPRMNYSYKPVLIKAMMELADSRGSAPVEAITNYFLDFYRKRWAAGLAVDKPDSTFVKYPDNAKRARSTILTYPYKRFAMKGFMTYDKQSGNISIVPDIWTYVSERMKHEISRISDLCLEKYYDSVSPTNGTPEERKKFQRTPFTSLFICYLVGYYKDGDKEKHCYSTDINAGVVIQNGQLTIYKSESIYEAIKDVGEITVSPILCKIDPSGTYLGVPHGERYSTYEENGESEDSGVVNAPYLLWMPLTYECKVLKKYSYEINTRIINITAAPTVLDEKGEIDLRKLFENMTFFRQADGI